MEDKQIHYIMDISKHLKTDNNNKETTTMPYSIEEARLLKKDAIRSEDQTLEFIPHNQRTYEILRTINNNQKAWRQKTEPFESAKTCIFATTTIDKNIFWLINNIFIGKKAVMTLVVQTDKPLLITATDTECDLHLSILIANIKQ